MLSPSPNSSANPFGASKHADPARDVHAGLRRGPHCRLGRALERDDRRYGDTARSSAPALGWPSRARDPRGSRRLILRRRCPPPCARRTSVYISDPYYIVNYQAWRAMRFYHSLGSTSNSAANSAAGPVSAARIPLPAAPPNCRQQFDLSMIYNFERTLFGTLGSVSPCHQGNLVRPLRGADR